MWYVYPSGDGFYLVRFAKQKRSIAGFKHKADADAFADKMSQKGCNYKINQRGLSDLRQLRRLKQLCGR